MKTSETETNKSLSTTKTQTNQQQNTTKNTNKKATTQKPPHPHKTKIIWEKVIRADTR